MEVRQEETVPMETDCTNDSNHISYNTSMMMMIDDDDRDIILSLSFSSYVCVLMKGERLRLSCSRIETLLLIYSSW